MAVARKCDRCGKLYEEYIVECERLTKHKINAVRLVHKNRNENTDRGLAFDLCPECMEKFKSFMNIQDKWDIKLINAI